MFRVVTFKPLKMGSVWGVFQYRHQSDLAAGGPLPREADEGGNVHLNALEAKEILEGSLLHVDELIEDLTTALTRLYQTEHRVDHAAYVEIMGHVNIIRNYVYELSVEVDHVTIDPNVN